MIRLGCWSGRRAGRHLKLSWRESAMTLLRWTVVRSSVGKRILPQPARGGRADTRPPNLKTGNVSGNALPASVAKLPIIGVAAGALATVGLLVAGAGVDDGEGAKNADQHVMLGDVLDRCAAADLRQKGLAVDEAAIGIGVEEVGCEVGVKPPDIGFIDRPDVVAVEFLQRCTVALVVGHEAQSPRRCDARS